jgi:hypothetical protein
MPGGQPPPIDPGYRPTRGYMRRVRASWPLDLLDVIALVGLLLVGFGLYVVWEPLAAVVVGVLLIVYAFYAAIPPRQ